QGTSTQQVQDRKTSKPYTGDLSIFESPGRDERLQINRVMDILGIGPGKNVADIGAGSGWFTVRAADASPKQGQCTLWTSTQRQYATSVAAYSEKNCAM